MRRPWVSMGTISGTVAPCTMTRIRVLDLRAASADAPRTLAHVPIVAWRRYRALPRADCVWGADRRSRPNVVVNLRAARPVGCARCDGAAGRPLCGGPFKCSSETSRDVSPARMPRPARAGCRTLPSARRPSVCRSRAGGARVAMPAGGLTTAQQPDAAHAHCESHWSSNT
jgi:hypothetical protein